MATRGTYSRILTLRVSSPLESRLRAEARRLKLSTSEAARQILEEGLSSPRPLATLAELAGDLIGSVSSDRVPSGHDVRKVMDAVAREKRAAHLRSSRLAAKRRG
jgi:hypothetical protein